MGEVGVTLVKVCNIMSGLQIMSNLYTTYYTYPPRKVLKEGEEAGLRHLVNG